MTGESKTSASAEKVPQAATSVVSSTGASRRSSDGERTEPTAERDQRRLGAEHEPEADRGQPGEHDAGQIGGRVGLGAQPVRRHVAAAAGSRTIAYATINPRARPPGAATRLGRVVVAKRVGQLLEHAHLDLVHELEEAHAARAATTPTTDASTSTTTNRRLAIICVVSTAITRARGRPPSHRRVEWCGDATHVEHEQILPSGLGDEVGAGAGALLAHRVAHVGPDRVVRDAQLVRDLRAARPKPTSRTTSRSRRERPGRPRPLPPGGGSAPPSVTCERDNQDQPAAGGALRGRAPLDGDRAAIGVHSSASP